MDDLTKQAEKSIERSKLAEPFRESAEKTLSIDYSEGGRWAVSYSMPDGAKIRFNNRTEPELVIAQLRGMLADFTGRQASSVRDAAYEECAKLSETFGEPFTPEACMEVTAAIRSKIGK